MGRRLEYEVKTSVRLNMSNPQHVKINDVIQNLDPKIFKSKNQFIIDAIQFYIDNYGKETFVIKKKEKERAEYIRSEDIEDIKEEVIEVATNEARKEVIRLSGQPPGGAEPRLYVHSGHCGVAADTGWAERLLLPGEGLSHEAEPVLLLPGAELSDRGGAVSDQSDSEDGAVVGIGASALSGRSAA